VMMGAIFGLIYHLTGSLRVTIMLHMINNAAALALN
jgi:membrane protease YdiL (CAAX protease family)